MILIIYSCFLVLRQSFVNSSICGYTFGDREGTEYSKLLADRGIRYTIHGEFSHEWERYGDKICEKVDTSLIQPPEIWYSFSDHFYKHECEKHRADGEDSDDFIKRVLNTCSIFGGFLESIHCHVDDGRRVNVIQSIILEDQPHSHINKHDCDDRYRYETPSGQNVNVQKEQKYCMDVYRQTVSMTGSEDI
ncbi:hypothetical protein RF11_02604 [Thelohanellus kitauei]|uniref:Uncharacterized protein n=1 Tax=Thelohanellus kitauei TaxID=669202 RepID=A0A0C2MRA9_THEKT|nr:hypothetical protein RF11_02604 [Thelohanellus kitauei]